MKKVGELKKHIHLCNSYEERLLNDLEALNIRRKLNIITKKQYKKQLTGLLRGRSVNDWLDYYGRYKGACFNMIKEHEADRNFRTVLSVLLIAVLLFPFITNITGFSVYDQGVVNVNKIVSSNAYLMIDGVAQPIPLQTEFYNGEYIYRIKSLEIPTGAKKLEILDNNVVVFSKELT